MASEDFADRAFPPTERHRRQARVRGQVARSSELTAAATLLAIGCVLWMAAGSLAQSMAVVMKKALVKGLSSDITITSVSESTRATVWSLLFQIWPLLVVPLICGLTANLVQTGILWIPSAIAPRIRPTQRKFADRVAESVFRSVKFCLLGIVVWRFLTTRLLELSLSPSDEPQLLLVRPAYLLGELVTQLSLCVLIFGFVDYGFRFWRNEQSLMMTLEEKKREHSEEQVDIRIRQRRRNATGHSNPNLQAVDVERVAPAG